MNTLILGNKELESLKRLIEYIFDSEEKHYEECDIDDRDNHIYTDINRLKDFLKTND